MKQFAEQENHLCGLHGRKKGIQFNSRPIQKKRNIVFFLLKNSRKKIVPHVMFMNGILSHLYYSI